MAERSLIRHANDAEDVASGLRTFRDSLPRNATRITAIISELFAVSSVLREIDNAQGDPEFRSTFYRLRDDFDVVLPSLQRTLDAAFAMFAQSRERPYQMAWDHLGLKMEREEGLGLLERLETYHDFLRAQFDRLIGERPEGLSEMRRQLDDLLDAQEKASLRAERGSIHASGTYFRWLTEDPAQAQI